MPDLPPLVQHANKMQNAILCLRDNGFSESALMLLYAAIDQMAWLSISDEVAGGKEFKEWVNRYMFARNRVGLEQVSANDLWAARCGLIHTAAPESKDYFHRPPVRKIFYSIGIQGVNTSIDRAIVVPFESLAISFAAAVLWFLEDLQSNPKQEEMALKKLNRMLVFRTA